MGGLRSNISMSTEAGRYGTDMAENTYFTLYSIVFFPECSAPKSSGEALPGWNKSTARSILADYGSQT